MFSLRSCRSSLVNFEFSKGNFVGKFGGNFGGFFRTHKTQRLKHFGENLGAFFGRTFAAQKIFCVKIRSADVPPEDKMFFLQATTHVRSKLQVHAPEGRAMAWADERTAVSK